MLTFLLVIVIVRDILPRVFHKTGRADPHLIVIIEVEALIIEFRVLERHRIINTLLVHDWVVFAFLTADA